MTIRLTVLTLFGCLLVLAAVIVWLVHRRYREAHARADLEFQLDALALYADALRASLWWQQHGDVIDDSMEGQ